MTEAESKSEEPQARYTKRFLGGGSQIEHLYFRREALDRYRADPRYKFVDYGHSGRFWVPDKYYLDSSFPEEDKVSMRWGTVYADESSDRYVTAILWDLHELTHKHQLHWASHEVDGAGLRLDADYFRTSIAGEAANRLSPFDAVVMEIQEVNAICERIGEPPLFREDFRDGRPTRFAWASTPTLQNYQDLALVTDRMLADNLRRQFFLGKVDLKARRNTAEGIEVRDKGTIELLAEFLGAVFPAAAEEGRDRITAALRFVRSERRRPAHALDTDKFDPELVKLEHQLVREALAAVQGLRELLQTHPSAEGYEVPRALAEAEIW